MQTVGERLDARRGVAPGFDFLRIFLACSIVAWHVEAIATGALDHSQEPFLWVFGYATLAAFFGLSGFLIAGSAQRLSLGNFLINRGLRIVPALAVEIVLSALILGPLFTTLTLDAYFSNSGTWRYFTNIFGVINYVLPGVFKDHPTEIVNNTLWTVPHEIGCYVIMSGLMITGLVRRTWLLAVAAGAIVVTGLLLSPYLGPDAKGFNRVLWFLFVSKASRLYVCFILGILAYALRERIPYSPALFTACLAATLAVGAISQPNGINYPLMNAIIAVPMIYLTVYIGVTDVWIPKIFKKGDYSYGIYLYGWPLQQMLVALLPRDTSLVLQFLLVVPAITVFAAFSWHFIEKPILRMRKKFSFVARVRLEEDAGGVAANPGGDVDSGEMAPAGSREPGKAATAPI